MRRATNRRTEPLTLEPDFSRDEWRAPFWHAMRFYRSSRPYFLQALTSLSQWHPSARVRELRARGRKLAGLRT